MTVEEYVGPGRAEPMRQRLQAFADGFGVTLGSPPRISNTRAAIAAAEYARDQGCFEAFWDAAMHAHWRDGGDLEDDEVLGSLAATVGLDAEATVTAARSPEYIARVDDLRKRANDVGVAGIPAFLFPNERIVGCQPYERLAAAAERAGATKQ